MKKNQDKPADAAELRRRAEERLGKKQKSRRPAARALIARREDTAPLVHELQVHQIELEMQNEELKQARATADALLVQYTDLYDFAPAGYLTLGREGAIRQLNLTGARLLGVERSELVNRRFGQFVAQSDRRAFSDFLAKVFDARTREACEVMLAREENGPRVVRIEAAAREDGQECCTVMVDITDRMQAEERHSTILKTAMDGFWVIDVQGRILEVNDTFCQMTGYGHEELLRMSIPDLEAIEAPQETADRIRGIVAAGKNRFETRHRRKDGRIIDVEVSVTYMGGPSNLMFSFTRDITEHKRAAESMRESEERFRTLIEAVTDYAYKVSVQDGRVVETTHGPGCLGVTGYSPEKFHAEPELWFRMVHSEDQPAVLDRATKLSSGQKAAPLVHRIIHRNGEIRWVRNSAVPRHDRRGQFIGYEGLIQDITEHRKIQEQFAQAQKMEAVGLLAGGVAHDFRNQLTVIKGYGEMLARRGLVMDAGKEPLEHILKAADRSAIVAGQLLAFSRQQTLRPEVVNIDSLASEMVKSLAQTLGDDIRLSVMPCSDLWNTRVDTGLFQQMLLNLVLNAQDAMPQGGQLTIETENIVLDESSVRGHAEASPGRYVVLTVSDTGAGIPPEALDHIFDPFFTTKPVGEGTGLGLAMAHGFVAQSRGFIEVQSKPGQPTGDGSPTAPGGTTFRLYFPAVDDVAEVAWRLSQAPGLPQGSGTILVVEDEVAIRGILVETLGECGYTVLTAGNAQEAMALIESKKNKIDLLITDVVMPGWSGPKLAKHFQAARPGVPVLMISGHTGKMLTGHGVVPPEVNLLIKPFSSQTLAETVQKALGQPKRP